MSSVYHLAGYILSFLLPRLALTVSIFLSISAHLHLLQALYFSLSLYLSPAVRLPQPIPTTHTCAEAARASDHGPKQEQEEPNADELSPLRYLPVREVPHGPFLRSEVSPWSLQRWLQSQKEPVPGSSCDSEPKPFPPCTLARVAVAACLEQPMMTQM